MAFIKDRINSIKNAFRGVFVFFKTFGGVHAKIHALATILVIGLGVYLNITSLHWIALIIAICLVLVTEIINSSVEQLVDLVQPEWDEKAGIIKDMAAGAVIVASIVAVIIGFLVFKDYV